MMGRLAIHVVFLPFAGAYMVFPSDFAKIFAIFMSKIVHFVGGF